MIVPAVVAGFAGMVLGVVVFAPFVALAYRRYRRLTLRYMLGWLGFLVYFIAIWTYTLAPFPDRGESRCAQPQLTPLASIPDALSYPHASASQLLHNPVLAQMALNVALFVPLGLFARLLWRRGPLVAAAVGAGLSLFVELTQLTGVWGLYPCAYRVFDVDDLITNTSGALIGAALALFLPRGWLTPEPQPRGEPAPVTAGRRLAAMVCDGLAVPVLGFGAALAVQVIDQYTAVAAPAALAGQVAFATPFAVQVVCVLVSGRSLGDVATLLRWSPARPAWLGKRLARLAGGVCGFQLLGLAPGPWSSLQAVFALAALVTAMAGRRRRGLPGLLGRQELTDARAPRP
ncbi:MAG: VanZ family protein [Bifidobacteriaceae bacterium]|jgi:glycopeptide antibiotics resistance protein|nr:VanZ family protein [Bifidobacteriaceae bacterium]